VSIAGIIPSLKVGLRREVHWPAGTCPTKEGRCFLARERVPTWPHQREFLSALRGVQAEGAEECKTAGTTKDALHHLLYDLPEDQAELARFLLEDLQDAADSGSSPLDEEALASLDRGLRDIAAGREKPLDEYQRERGL